MIFEGISWLPVLPHPARNFKLEKGPFLRKSSSLIFQPKEKEGKNPYLLFAPNLDEPSIRKFAVAKYLFLYE